MFLSSASRIPCTFCLICVVQRIRPSPMLCDIFRYVVRFNGQEVLVPCPTPKLEKHPLSAVREYLFSAATLYSWRESPPFAEWGRVIPRWESHSSWNVQMIDIQKEELLSLSFVNVWLSIYKRKLSNFFFLLNVSTLRDFNVGTTGCMTNIQMIFDFFFWHFWKYVVGYCGNNVFFAGLQLLKIDVFNLVYDVKYQLHHKVLGRWVDRRAPSV